MRFFKFSVKFKKVKENGETYYLVTVPSLPEVVTQGYSIEEARFMAQDALELVILSRLEHGEEIPDNKKITRIHKDTVVEDIVVSVIHQVSATPADYVKASIFQSA